MGFSNLLNRPWFLWVLPGSALRGGGGRSLPSLSANFFLFLFYSHWNDLHRIQHRTAANAIHQLRRLPLQFVHGQDRTAPAIRYVCSLGLWCSCLCQWLERIWELSMWVRMARCHGRDGVIRQAGGGKGVSVTPSTLQLEANLRLHGAFHRGRMRAWSVVSFEEDGMSFSRSLRRMKTAMVASGWFFLGGSILLTIFHLPSFLPSHLPQSLTVDGYYHYEKPADFHHVCDLTNWAVPLAYATFGMQVVLWFFETVFGLYTFLYLDQESLNEPMFEWGRRAYNWRLGNDPTGTTPVTQSKNYRARTDGASSPDGARSENSRGVGRRGQAYGDEEAQDEMSEVHSQASLGNRGRRGATYGQDDQVNEAEEESGWHLREDPSTRA